MTAKSLCWTEHLGRTRLSGLGCSSQVDLLFQLVREDPIIVSVPAVWSNVVELVSVSVTADS